MKKIELGQILAFVYQEVFLPRFSITADIFSSGISLDMAAKLYNLNKSLYKLRGCSPTLTLIVNRTPGEVL